MIIKLPIDSATAELTFVDSQNISSWAQQAIATVVQNGIISDILITASAPRAKPPVLRR